MNIKRRDRMTKPQRHTAYHEAGHAVVGRVLTLACGRASIKPNYREGSAGVSITKDPYACLHEWEKRGKVRESPDAVLHARIMTYMAGAEAERELLGRCQEGDEDDRYQINLMVEELHPGADWVRRLEPRLRAMTRMLVRRHRVLIERTAEALLKRKTISAKELDKIIGRSVNDVKVNAPLLLVMSQMNNGAKQKRGRPRI